MDAEHDLCATANSHELIAIDVSRSITNNVPSDAGYESRASADLGSSSAPGTVPRSGLRMVAVMAALFVSVPSCVHCN